MATTLRFDYDSDTNSTSAESKDSNVAEIVLLSQKLKGVALGYRHLIGQIKNVGNDTTQTVVIIYTFYDKNGDMVGTDSTFSDASVLKPGQKSTNKLFSSTDNFKGMKYKEISLQWSNSGDSGGPVEVQTYKFKK